MNEGTYRGFGDIYLRKTGNATIHVWFVMRRHVNFPGNSARMDRRNMQPGHQWHNDAELENPLWKVNWTLQLNLTNTRYTIPDATDPTHGTYLNLLFPPKLPKWKLFLQYSIPDSNFFWFDILMTEHMTKLLENHTPTPDVSFVRTPFFHNIFQRFQIILARFIFLVRAVRFLARAQETRWLHKFKHCILSSKKSL